MDPLRILKALSNPHRLDIILWLKHPEQEFGVQVHFKTLIDFPNSVSVKSIQKRCGVSQSSVSTFRCIAIVCIYIYDYIRACRPCGIAKN